MGPPPAIRCRAACSGVRNASSLRIRRPGHKVKLRRSAKGWRPMPIDGCKPGDGSSPPVPPYWFDGMTGGETPPRVAAAAALDDFADALSNAPRWLLETGCGGAITLRVCSHRQGEGLEILAELAGEPVQIVLEPHASGWLSIAAVCGEDRKSVV